MQVGECLVASQLNAAPDDRADFAEIDPELVDFKHPSHYIERGPRFAPGFWWSPSWQISQSSRVEIHNIGFGIIATSVALFIFALGLGTLLGRDDAYGVNPTKGIYGITLAFAIVGSLGLRIRNPNVGGALALVLLLLASALTVWSIITPLLGVIAAYLWFGARNRKNTDSP